MAPWRTRSTRRASSRTPARSIGAWSGAIVVGADSAAGLAAGERRRGAGGGKLDGAGSPRAQPMDGGRIAIAAVAGALIALAVAGSSAAFAARPW